MCGTGMGGSERLKTPGQGMENEDRLGVPSSRSSHSSFPTRVMSPPPKFREECRGEPPNHIKLT